MNQPLSGILLFVPMRSVGFDHNKRLSTLGVLSLTLKRTRDFLVFLESGERPTKFRRRFRVAIHCSSDPKVRLLSTFLNQSRKITFGLPALRMILGERWRCGDIFASADREPYWLYSGGPSFRVFSDCRVTDVDLCHALIYLEHDREIPNLVRQIARRDPSRALDLIDCGARLIGLPPHVPARQIAPLLSPTDLAVLLSSPDRTIRERTTLLLPRIGQPPTTQYELPVSATFF